MKPSWSTTLETCRRQIKQAEMIGWEALAQSWQRTLDEEIAKGRKEIQRTGGFIAQWQHEKPSVTT